MDPDASSILSVDIDDFDLPFYPTHLKISSWQPLLQHRHNPSSDSSLTDPAIRADSPLLGFPHTPTSSQDPLHFPCATYARDLPLSDIDPALAREKPLPTTPIPPSFTKLPFHPSRPSSSLTHSSSSSFSHTRRSPSSASSNLARKPSLPVIRGLTGSPLLSFPRSSSFDDHDKASLPPSFTRLPFHPTPRPSTSATHSPTASLSRRPSASFARQSSLPLLQETTALGSTAHLPLPSLSIATSRSRSNSAAQLSPLPPSSSPTRRQSSYPRFSSFSSTLSLIDPATPEPPSTSCRNAVYIDSEEVKQRLDLLLQSRHSQSSTTDFDENEFVDGYYQPEDTPRTTLYIPPPNTPDWGTGFTSLSQVVPGLPNEEEESDVGRTSSEEDSAASVSTPGTSPGHYPYTHRRGSSFAEMRDAYLSRGSVCEEEEEDYGQQIGSRWSRTSSVVDPISPVQPTSPAADSSTPSIPSAQANANSKRQRLASFISRLSGGPSMWDVSTPNVGPAHPGVMGVGVYPRARANSTMNPRPSPAAHPPARSASGGGSGTGYMSMMGMGMAVPPPPAVLFSSEVLASPISLASSPQLRKSAEGPSLPSTPTATSFPRTIEEVEEEETIKARGRGGERSLRSVGSMGNLTLSTASATAAVPRSPVGDAVAVAVQKEKEMKRRSGGAGLRGLVRRIGLVHAPSSDFDGDDEAGTRGSKSPKMVRSKSKRKLVISGVGEGDVRGYEAVRAWCESFGEVRQMTRSKSGCLYVDFRKASVADTVCRVQAQVYIRGAGSVSLGWSTKKNL